MKAKYYLDIATGDYDYLIGKDYDTIEECINLAKGFRAIIGQLNKFINDNGINDDEWSGNDIRAIKIKCTFYAEDNDDFEISTIATIRDDYSLEYGKKEIIVEYKDEDDINGIIKFKTKEEMEQWLELNKEKHTLVEWKETY